MKLDVNLQTGEIEMILLATEKRVLENALKQTRLMSKIKAVEIVQKYSAEAAVALSNLMNMLPKEAGKPALEAKEESPPLSEPAAVAPKSTAAGQAKGEAESPAEPADDLEGELDLRDDEAPSDSDGLEAGEGFEGEPEDIGDWTEVDDETPADDSEDDAEVDDEDAVDEPVGGDAEASEPATKRASASQTKREAVQAGGGLPPRKPNESLVDYRKRIMGLKK